jgi:hypothetical protein
MSEFRCVLHQTGSTLTLDSVPCCPKLRVRSRQAPIPSRLAALCLPAAETERCSLLILIGLSEKTPRVVGTARCPAALGQLGPRYLTKAGRLIGRPVSFWICSCKQRQLCRLLWSTGALQSLCISWEIACHVLHLYSPCKPHSVQVISIAVISG